MNVVLTFQEMKKAHSGEWLLIGDPELDSTHHLIAGKVLAHSPDRDVIYRQLLRAKGKSFGIEYAGPVPEDLAVAL